MHEQRFILAHISAKVDPAVEACVQVGQVQIRLSTNHSSGAVFQFKSEIAFRFDKRELLDKFASQLNCL